MKRIAGIMLPVVLLCMGSFAEVLLEVDFAGTPGASMPVITEPDAQLTTHSAVTNHQRIFLPGGTLDSTNWVYSADGQSALNVDLYPAPTHGCPTRVDLGLALAAAGKQYTITNIEVAVTEAGTTDVDFCLYYTAVDSPAISDWIKSEVVTIPSGTTGTFALDTTLFHLVANDSETSWNHKPSLNGDLRIAFWESNSTNVDHLAIDSVTVNGITEEYVEPVPVEDPVWNFNTPGDVEGWTQSGNAHISGIAVLPAFSGTETVLTCSGITADDPQLLHYGLFAPASNYWYQAEIRIRQLDTVGTPLAWEPAACAVLMGGEIVTLSLGDDTVAEAGEWITVMLDLTDLGSDEIDGLRIDPVGGWGGTNKLFEIDYIRLTSTDTPPELQVPDDTFWEFNTPGDLEGWFGADGLGTLEIAASDGGESVLISQGVTGSDAKLYGPGVSPGSLYWSTMEVRVRQLDATNGTPLAWSFGGCSVVVNGTIMTALGNTIAWDVTTEAGEWITAALDISQFQSADIYEVRLDPIGDNSRNFEFDYIRLNKATTPPPPEASWEFNTIGDLEGWTGSSITNLMVTNAVSGSETVLTSDGLLGVDPTLNKGVIINSGGFTWTTAEMRVRHLDSGGNPIPFNISGTVMVLNGVVFQGNWKVIDEGSDAWVICKIDISEFEDNTLNGLRMDPVGNDASKNFEVDYIRLNSTFLAPVESVIEAWEFNTPGDIEGFEGFQTMDLTVDSAVAGDESVLTCASVTGIDPQVMLPYNAAVSPGDGAWTKLEIRMRQLAGNPPSAIPQAWSLNGTLFFLNMGYAGSVNLGGIPGANATITTESNDWIVAEIDISSIGIFDLTNFRLDPVGNDVSKNFEIDWIRAYALVPPVGYSAWTASYGLKGYHGDKSADPDEDNVDNLTEFAFGGNPIDDEDAGLPCLASVVNVGSNVMQVVYYRRSGNEHNLTYSLETRNDLILPGWFDLAGYSEAGYGRFNIEMDAVTNYVPIVSDTQFIRVEAVEE